MNDNSKDTLVLLIVGGLLFFCAHTAIRNLDDERNRRIDALIKRAEQVIRENEQKPDDNL